MVTIPRQNSITGQKGQEMKSKDPSMVNFLQKVFVPIAIPCKVITRLCDNTSCLITSQIVPKHKSYGLLILKKISIVKYNQCQTQTRCLKCLSSYDVRYMLVLANCYLNLLTYLFNCKATVIQLNRFLALQAIFSV